MKSSESCCSNPQERRPEPDPEGREEGEIQEMLRKYNLARWVGGVDERKESRDTLRVLT